ncbi:hypothetical protein N566_16625 [Streptomycetaceae bacterium MP113-05]|nr:hypothetical protein N566_16625 [Streptomycetaceae bacterium MP113-05]
MAGWAEAQYENMYRLSYLRAARASTSSWAEQLG